MGIGRAEREMMDGRVLFYGGGLRNALHERSGGDQQDITGERRVRRIEVEQGAFKETAGVSQDQVMAAHGRE